MHCSIEEEAKLPFPSAYIFNKGDLLRDVKKECNYMKMLQNLLSFIMDNFDHRVEDSNFVRQSEKRLASTLGIKKNNFKSP